MSTTPYDDQYWNPLDNQYWPYVNPPYFIPYYQPTALPQLRYEYRCPKCGYVNVKYQITARIVCFSCNHEFYPT